MTKTVIGLNAEGKVVEKLDDAVVMHEIELDKDDKLVSSTIHVATGKDLPPVISEK